MLDLLVRIVELKLELIGRFRSKVLKFQRFREVKQPNPDEMWFKIGGKLLRFGIQEFAIATGLLCVGDTDKTILETKRVRLFDKYFKKYPRFDKVALEDAFLNGSFETNEDLVNVACLYLIKNYLIWAYDCFDKLVGTVCYKTASKIPRILNFFCDVSPYFEELEKNIFEADEISVHIVVPTVEEITKYRFNELSKRVQQPVLESLGNVAAARDVDVDFVDNPSKVPAPPKVFGPSNFSVEGAPFTSKSSQAKAGASILQFSKEMDLMKNEIFHQQDLIKGSIDLMKKDFDAKFDVLLTMLTRCQEKLGIDAVACSAGPVNQVVDHSPNVVGDDVMGIGNDNVSKNTLMDIDVPMEEENQEETPQVDEADKNSEDNDEDKADVPDVDIIVEDVITPGFIPDCDPLEVEGVDSVNELKDAVKDSDEEGKDTEESKEEEEEDNDNDNKDEGKYDENDKDDKDGPDNGAGKAVDKFANDGNEDETDGSHNIADKGVDNSAKKDVNDDKGSDNSSKDGNEETIDICDPIAEKDDEFFANLDDDTINACIKNAVEEYSKGSESSLKTPVLPKRETKPSAQLRSPFINEFGSSADSAQIGSSGALSDCGVFVIAYAEFFIHDMLDELKKNFQVQNYRNKLSVELYMHLKKKQNEGYESELDFKGRLSKKMKNTKT
ncbi:Ulp1 protease family, C-terminal catalytic domain containing protein [Trema orientale]|uniref:Ulp1 protease family, C-terminal catalytic domain containing protein n=1 Tax=Trema orientale TaxID=63057 RepID=A0A2P5FLW8_TREOI|nr:Ulp1 protease family, C-terminal catalytic domain containing protein [Trema orientale]